MSSVPEPIKPGVKVVAQLEARAADAPPLTKGMLVFVFTVIWGAVSVAAFMLLANVWHALLVALVGLGFWMLLLRRQGWVEKLLRAQHSRYVQAQTGFCCQVCQREIAEPVKHRAKHGEPILYHCETCNILWFTGTVDHSTA